MLIQNSITKLDAEAEKRARRLFSQAEGDAA
jgi:hypothetical protein